MTDIVFVQPPVSLEEVYSGLAETASVTPPFSLMLLASITRSKGYSTAIIDCPGLGLDYDGAVKRISSLNPKVIGFTAMTPHVCQMAKLAEKYKKTGPNTIIILGGVHVTAVPDETMKRFKDIDIGVIGEAEITIIDLLNTILNKGDLNNVKGIVLRGENGVLEYTGKPESISVMDSLPYYAWDLLNEFPERYKPPLFAHHRTPFAAVIISRGCNGKCTFCYSGSHVGLKNYSAEYTFNMIKFLIDKYGIKELAIYDDNFVMYRKHLFELCDRIIESKLDLTWSCNARVDLVNEDILRIMKKAGCWQISYGIESGSQNVIDTLNKNISLKHIREVLQLTKKIGLRTVGYFMIGNFEESKRSIEETISFAKSVDLDDFRMSFFTPLPGSSAYNLAGKYGIFERNWEKMTLFQPVFIPNGLTKDDLIKYQKLAIRKFFFRPSTVFSYAKMVRKPVVIFKGVKILSQYVFR